MTNPKYQASMTLEVQELYLQMYETTKTLIQAAEAEHNEWLEAEKEHRVRWRLEHDTMVVIPASEAPIPSKHHLSNLVHLFMMLL